MTNFDALFHTLKRPSFLIGMFVLLIYLFCYIDIPIAESCHFLRDTWLHPLCSIFTVLGFGAFYLVLLPALALCTRYLGSSRLWARRFLFLWGGLVCTSLFCMLCKVLLGRARPDLWFSHHWFGFFGFKWDNLFWSFPSGHTATGMGLAYLATCLHPKYWYAYWGLGTIIAISRVLMDYHYVSDVLATAYVVLFIIAGYKKLVQHWFVEVLP
ncbi:MAG: phosphatase PAP2 family protein [Legionellaceae bacterium]|nr:phosphatase PAP2 family protein [Legionellaceae bacterium]